VNAAAVDFALNPCSKERLHQGTGAGHCFSGEARSFPSGTAGLLLGLAGVVGARVFRTLTKLIPMDCDAVSAAAGFDGQWNHFVERIVGGRARLFHSAADFPCGAGESRGSARAAWGGLLETKPDRKNSGTHDYGFGRMSHSTAVYPSAGALWRLLGYLSTAFLGIVRPWTRMEWRASARKRNG